MTTAGRPFAHVVGAYKDTIAAGAKFKGECLMLCREELGAPAVSPTAVAAAAATQHRVDVTFEASPDGTYLYYSGGSAGAGHVAFRAGHNAQGSPLVYTNDDLRLGQVRLIQLKSMELLYPRLKRDLVAWDCDGYATADSPIFAPAVTLDDVVDQLHAVPTTVGAAALVAELQTLLTQLEGLVS